MQYLCSTSSELTPVQTPLVFHRVDHNLKAVAVTLPTMTQPPLTPLPTDTHFERLQASAPVLRHVYLPLVDFLEENGQMGLAVILALHSESCSHELWQLYPSHELNTS